MGLGVSSVPCDWPLALCFSTVLYDGCPKSLKAGVWWPQTKFGLSTAVLCPKGSLGEWGMWWGGEAAAWLSCQGL